MTGDSDHNQLSGAAAQAVKRIAGNARVAAAFPTPPAIKEFSETLAAGPHLTSLSPPMPVRNTRATDENTDAIRDLIAALDRNTATSAALIDAMERSRPTSA